MTYIYIYLLYVRKRHINGYKKIGCGFTFPTSMVGGSKSGLNHQPAVDEIVPCAVHLMNCIWGWSIFRPKCADMKWMLQPTWMGIFGANFNDCLFIYIYTHNDMYVLFNQQIQIPLRWFWVTCFFFHTAPHNRNHTPALEGQRTTLPSPGATCYGTPR